MLGRCSHEFSWPRRDQDGHYYQVCMLCAVQYNYDWKTMRRTERVEAASGAQPARRSHARTEGKAKWVPRARRLKLDISVRYRARNAALWHTGTIENISHSGVMFLGEQPFPANTLVEMVFEMPEEISGQKDASVLCQGRIIRAKDTKRTETRGQAASILDYKFLHLPYRDFGRSIE